LFGLLEAFEAGGHGCMSSLHPTLRKRREGWGTRPTAANLFHVIACRSLKG